jgi:peptidoglycan hydrolase FlgJ
MAAPASLMPASSAAGAFANLSARNDPTAIAKVTIAKDNARNVAQDFEASFLNSMFSQMFTSIEGEGPFGGGPAVGVWRSFLTEEYSKSFAKKGGIGIADEVYRTLMAQQEIKPAKPLDAEGSQK